MNKVFEKIIEKQKELFQDLNVIEVLSHVDFDSTIQNSLDNFLKAITNEAIEIVKQEAEKRNNGWIPCSERLPEDGETYLVTNAESFGQCHTYKGWYDGKHKIWHMEENFERKMNVVAWQPLPQPYQPKG